MKVVILAGGLGTRLNEETVIKPKPMVEVGGMPIIWHIMKIYSHYGYNEFVVCLGYKSHYIKEWFNNYYLNTSDVTLNLEDNSKTFHKNHGDKWKITLVETGDLTATSGRIKKIQDYIGQETFMLTYGDGLSDVNVKELVDFHKKNKVYSTVTAVIPEGKFGVLDINEKLEVTSFSEKTDNKSRINGGFFVLEPEVFDYLGDGTAMFEKEPLEKLAKDGQFKAFPHDRFWKPMDTLNDKNKLEEIWNKGNAPWKVWKE